MGWSFVLRRWVRRMGRVTMAVNEGKALMSKSRPLGGVIHTYQKYDPKNFPSPTQPPPDMVSPAFEHMLTYGSMRELTDEETGPRGPSRSQPDRRAGAEPRNAWPQCSASASGRFWRRTRPTRCSKTAARSLPRDGGRMRAAQEACATRFKRLSKTSRFATSSDCGISRRRALGIRPAVDAAHRAAGRQIPGRRAGGEIRIHRPHSR